MAEDGGTYKISSDFLQGFARDRINAQFVEQFDKHPDIVRLRLYAADDSLLAGNPKANIQQTAMLRKKFNSFAVGMVKLLDEMKEGMLKLSDNLVGVDHITQQGEQDAKDIALQTMMDDLKVPLSIFGGSGATQSTTEKTPTTGV
ncbi:hypothetical protein [Streptomyces sp. NPDC002225]|uniref:hypothetical protein n=1 Tax=Streptomyces sp. NPDC002225 TaxID=3154413 RepID=UPI00331F5FEB